MCFDDGHFNSLRKVASKSLGLTGQTSSASCTNCGRILLRMGYELKKKQSAVVFFLPFSCAGKIKKNVDGFSLDETTLKVDANTCALKLVYTIWR